MSSIFPVVPLTGELSEIADISGEIVAIDPPVISGAISDDLLSAHKYTGDYVVVPRKIEQSLETADKLMIYDVTIEAINYSEVDNLSGGKTVNIGYE